MAGGRRVFGLVMLSMGAGMLLVIVVPGWGFVLAAIMVLAGIWMMISW